MAKACEECTQNCLMLHKKRKDPSSLVTTFFKVMMADDYAKILYLPPKFARNAKKLGDRTTLEDFNGERWDVEFTKIDGHLAFKEGWDAFALNHGLQKGDFLVFHYIMKSHFVVLMYGLTGFPENRHFGFPMNETEKDDNDLIKNGQSPSKLPTNCINLSHESSSKSVPPVLGVNNLKTIDNKLNETNNQHLVATSSQPAVKVADQRSELSIKNTTPDYGVADSPTAVKPLRIVDKGNGHEQDQTGQNSEPLLKNTIPDYMVANSSTAVKPLCLVDNDNGHEQDQTGQNSEPLLKNTIPDYMVANSSTAVKPLCLVDNDNGHEQDQTGQSSEPLLKNTIPAYMVANSSTTVKPLCLVANGNGHEQDQTGQNSEPFLKNTIPDYVVANSSTTVKLLCSADNGNGHEQDQTGQSSEPLLKNTSPDHMVANSSTTVKPLSLGDNSNGHEQTKTDQTSEPLLKATIPDSLLSDRDNGNGHKQAECRRNILDTVAVAAQDGGQKNNVVAAGGGGGGLKEAENNSFKKNLETRLEMANEKRKENAVTQNVVRQGHKRPNPAADVPITTPAKIVKTELSTRMHNNSGYPFTPSGGTPTTERVEPEQTMIHGSASGLVKKEPTAMNHGPIKREPKPEPVDYEESTPSNTSFSAIMTSYKYLELPSCVKLKSKVILLRNGKDLWPVLYQTKMGLKALTQNWGMFAKEKGIKPGDTCEFMLESEPSTRFTFTCNVFGVRVTR